MEEQKFKADVIIDANGAVLGRVASLAAKQALFGKTVAIVNCEKAVITGRVRFTVEEYKHKRQRGGSSLNGPHFPKSADMIMKRTVRGMLNYTFARGHDAFKRIRCFNGIPKEFESAKKISPIRELKTKSLPLERISREL
ncbi:MAG: 50S ribosomal protein L13 [Candidatus Nanoarchaeia archaeon]|nr:50S ribosomal protein L13 [Candidatus Nanoarchaeia archaeon]